MGKNFPEQTKARKAFFFEKKKQKIFLPVGGSSADPATAESKVFCFFFSKKKAFLA